jgi:hypothetical protein
MSRSAIRFFAFFMLAAVFLTALHAYGAVHVSVSASDCCHHGDSPDHSLPESDSDGCHSCGTCPCHAPLVSALLFPPFAPVVTALQSFYSEKQIPEVYLSKFIPPQNS